ncbi:hypothetical protein [Bauldia sp.]|uniref:hypothetical protein n=1 Tax=Bauldia sp. TaxID=2575872 RepID=UPI003BAD6285
MVHIIRQLVIVLGAVVLTGGGAFAQIDHWNHVIQDPALEKAFHRALNEVAEEYIAEMEAQDRPAGILFLDSQRFIPLVITSSTFRPDLIMAMKAKANYIHAYQARSTAGVTVQIAEPAGISGALAGGNYVGLSVPEGGEIPGDGGVMVCPINKAGLKFMYGALAIASLDETGRFRVEEDGVDIEALRERILTATYEYYGNTPE